jgi:hypothetical protein
LNFLDRFSKNPQISNYIKIRSGGAELFHTDRWTDMRKLTVTSCNFENAPKNRTKSKDIHSIVPTNIFKYKVVQI